jgi:3,4-dihydroxy 2-butanone 4-phosphate synthase/GTP cyclohydrolase II
VICEIMNDDGTMARVPDLIEFCKTHGLQMLTVADLIRYRMQNERYVHRIAEAQLPTRHGEFRMIAYESEAGKGGSVDGSESHIAMVFGDLEAASAADTPVLVRVHTHCLAGNIFGSELCDCRATVDASLDAIAAAGCGALVYLHHTQRGFGLEYALRPDQAARADRVSAADRATASARLIFHRSERGRAPEFERDQRDARVLRQVGLGGQILSDLGIRRIRLLSNHATHVPALQGFGIEIVERVPIDLRPQTIS